jgi:hypothetical protein
MKKVENQEKKKKILQQIGKYTTAAGAVLLTGNLANAEVHLTTTTIDLTPGIHGIDFDGDGLFELKVWVDQSTEDSSASIDIYLGSDPDATHFEDIHGGPYDTNADAAAFPLGRIIGPTLATGSSFWSNSSWDTIISTDDSSVNDGNFGYYPGVTRYAGIRFTKDGGSSWKYGWIGIQIADDFPLYDASSLGQIINFAYESTPDTPINAGGGSAVPVLPIVSALGLGLAGLFGYIRNRRKKSIVE